MKNYKKKKEEEILEKEPPKVVAPPKEFSTGIKIGRSRTQGNFLPVPKAPVEVLYNYVEPVITVNGPQPPTDPELSTEGYLQNVRRAEKNELAGGYKANISCHRVLEEAFAGLFFVPQQSLRSKDKNS